MRGRTQNPKKRVSRKKPCAGQLPRPKRILTRMKSRRLPAKGRRQGKPTPQGRKAAGGPAHGAPRHRPSLRAPLSDPAGRPESTSGPPPSLGMRRWPQTPRPSSPVWAEEERRPRERSGEGAEASRGRFAPLRAAPRRGPLRRDEAARSGSPGAEPAAPGAPKRQLWARSGPPHSPSAWSREFMAGGRRQRAPAVPLAAPQPPAAQPAPHYPPALAPPPQQHRALLADLPLAAPRSASATRIGYGEGRGAAPAI